jgi:hypothetical protein
MNFTFVSWLLFSSHTTCCYILIDSMVIQGVQLNVEPATTACSSSSSSELPGNEFVTQRRTQPSHASRWVQSCVRHSVYGEAVSTTRVIEWWGGVWHGSTLQVGHSSYSKTSTSRIRIRSANQLTAIFSMNTVHTESQKTWLPNAYVSQTEWTQ